jgi:nascent polypeptide-associated complex subunit beta
LILIATTNDDKRIQGVLKRLNVNAIPAIEEANMFKSDGSVIHFVNPKVQASIPSNTYVISGPSETKKLDELLPGILSQLGEENMEQIKELAAAAGLAGGAAPAAAAGAAASLPSVEEAADSDDDVPDFEDVSEQ